MKSKWLEIASPWLLTLALILLWEAVVNVFGISRIVATNSNEAQWSQRRC